MSHEFPTPWLDVGSKCTYPESLILFPRPSGATGIIQGLVSEASVKVDVFAFRFGIS